MSIFTPVNQIRLTNVAIVRLKRGGKRWEIACYPNKVMSWRKGLEKDIDEVVQSHEVFVNVSKGVVANKDVLQKAFKESDTEKILLMILNKGELQVTSKERQQTKENLLQEIASIVADKCVDAETQRPLTVGYVERAMKELHFNANTSKTAKVQALEVIGLMEASLPVKRANMRLRVEVPGKEAKGVADKLRPLFSFVEKEEFVCMKLVMIGTLAPKSFREVEEQLSAGTKGKGTLTILDLAVVADTDDGLLEGFAE